MNLSERVAYLRGMAEGMEIDTEQKEGKLFFAVLDTLEAAAADVAALRAENTALSEALDAVSADLEDVEAVVFDEAPATEEGEECYAATCPRCQETIYFDDGVLDEGGVLCPNCGERLEFLTEEADEPEDGKESPAALETLEDCGEE